MNAPDRPLLTNTHATWLREHAGWLDASMGYVAIPAARMRDAANEIDRLQALVDRVVWSMQKKAEMDLLPRVAQRCDYVGMYDGQCGLDLGHAGEHRLFGPHRAAAEPLPVTSFPKEQHDLIAYAEAALKDDYPFEVKGEDLRIVLDALERASEGRAYTCDCDPKQVKVCTDAEAVTGSPPAYCRREKKSGEQS